MTLLSRLYIRFHILTFERLNVALLPIYSETQIAPDRALTYLHAELGSFTFIYIIPPDR